MSPRRSPRSAAPEPGDRSPLRVLIVDDERLARTRLRRLLEARDDVEIAGECGNGREAVEALGGAGADADGAPGGLDADDAPGGGSGMPPIDLVFLDVQMPDLDGFEVIERVGARRMPAVVFVTAYDEYALRAFEVQAVDYLLKPFDDERFDAALGRAVRRARGGSVEELAGRLAALIEFRDRLQRIAVREGERTRLIDVDDIDWIEADGSYVRIHVGGRSHLHRESLGGLAARLGPERFARIHRSTVVNLDRVRVLHPLFHGEYLVELADGERLKLSRTYRDVARRLLEG